MCAIKTSKTPLPFCKQARRCVIHLTWQFSTDLQKVFKVAESYIDKIKPSDKFARTLSPKRKPTFARNILRNFVRSESCFLNTRFSKINVGDVWASYAKNAKRALFANMCVAEFNRMANNGMRRGEPGTQQFWRQNAGQDQIRRRCLRLWRRPLS